MTRNYPPGPKGLPLLGVLPKMLNPLDFFMESAETYGEVVHLDFGSNYAFLLSNPDHIKWVLQDNNRNYIKSNTLEIAREVLGKGLATNEGEDWLSQRRLIQPAFHHAHIEKLSVIMRDSAESWLPRWRPNTVVNVAEETYQLAADIVFKAMFSIDVLDNIDELLAAWDTVLTTFNNKSFAMWRIPMSWSTPANLRYKKAFALLNDSVHQIIRKRRELMEQDNDAESSDLLAMLLQAQDAETGVGMSDQQLRDEVMTMFLAGHDTTANAVTFALDLLARHPDKLAKLRTEWDDCLDGRTPTFADIPKLTYTRMVIDETLRLFPPAWLIFRAPIEDDQIGDYKLGGGNMVMISPHVLHRSPKHWDTPEAFRPERFAPERKQAISDFVYFPFGGGPRKCIGFQIALTEMMMVLPMLLQRYDITPISAEPLKLNASVTLQAKGKVPMRITAR